MININMIACGCKTFISDTLLQSDLNKWRISQLEKLDKLYMNSSSTRILQIYKDYFIECNNKIFPND